MKKPGLKMVYCLPDKSRVVAARANRQKQTLLRNLRRRM
jgi:hypothetical protein